MANVYVCPNCGSEHFYADVNAIVTIDLSFAPLHEKPAIQWDGLHSAEQGGIRITDGPFCSNCNQMCTLDELKLKER